MTNKFEILFLATQNLQTGSDFQQVILIAPDHKLG